MCNGELISLSQNWLFCGRGTTGFWAILKALDMPGKGVLVPSTICEVVVATILFARMVPVLYDVDKDQGSSRLEHVEAAVGPDIKALLVVHNYGSPSNMAPFVEFAKSRNLFLIEDACNSLGATVGGIPVGGFGDASFWSFGYSKIVDAGDGGAVHARDCSLREELKCILSNLAISTAKHKMSQRQLNVELRRWRQANGQPDRRVLGKLFAAHMPSLLYRIDCSVQDEIQRRLWSLEENVIQRNEKAHIYRQRIKSPLVMHREWSEGEVCWRYTFLVPVQKREVLLSAIRGANFHASNWYPSVDGLFEGAESRGDLAGASQFGERVVNLWVDSSVNRTDVFETARIVDEVMAA